MNKLFKEYYTDASYLMILDYSITFNWLDFLETFVKNVFNLHQFDQQVLTVCFEHFK